MLWTRSARAASTEKGLVGALLDRKGNVKGPVLMIRKADQFNVPSLLDLTYQSDKNLLAVIFEPTNEPDGNYLLLTIDPLLKKVKGKAQKVNTQLVTRNGQVRACLAGLENGSVMVFFGDNDNVKRRRIDANGKLSGKNLPALNSPLKNTLLTEPRVVFAKSTNGVTGLLVVTQDGGQGEIDKVWAQVLRPDGSPLGAPVQVNETSADANTQFGTLLGAVPSSSASEITRFVWVGAVVEVKSVALQEYEGGMIQLKLDVRLD